MPMLSFIFLSSAKNTMTSMARHQLSVIFVISTVFLFFSLALTQNPQPPQAAGPPQSSGPLNISAILERNGQFSIFIRLLKSTQVGDQVPNQLNNSNQGITIFAPTDDAFNSLKAGMLNSLTESQKVSLVQFHVVPQFLTTPQFQTVSNPLRTQAGGADGQFPLNITASGSQVNISTGVDETTVDSPLYTDGSLAIYRVNKVLLPIAFFGSTQSPASAPAPSLGSAPAPDSGLKKGKAHAADGTPVSVSTANSATSGEARVQHRVMGGLAMAALLATVIVM